MVNGKVERSQELSNEVTTPAVSEIVTVGTGPVSEKPTDAPVNEVPSLEVEEKDVTTTVAEPYTRERVESDTTSWPDQDNPSWSRWRPYDCHPSVHSRWQSREKPGNLQRSDDSSGLRDRNGRNSSC